MSLLGALQVGKSSLAAQQAGIQVTGNNIANAGTPGYTRQVVRLTTAGAEEIKPGTYVGTGVQVAGVERQINESLEESLRQSTSDQSAADLLNSLVGRLENTFGALNDSDLSARLDSFFNSFSTLANNPQDPGQRSVVIQNGLSLTNFVRDLRSKLVAQRQDVEAQVQTLGLQANDLVKNIAELNGKIMAAEAGGGTAAALRDQRDSSLSQLAELVDIRVVPQGNGDINVLVGSLPIIQGSTARPLGTKQATDPTGQFVTTTLTLADTGDPLTITGGKIGALINARDNYVTPAITTVDAVAAALINTVNSIHTQGQGLAGFSSVTGVGEVVNAAAPLNTLNNGLASVPVNGTFNLHIKDNTTGQMVTQQIAVNLSGTGTPTTLASLAAAISAQSGGKVTATVTPSGQLALQASANTSFSFSDDTSNVLSCLGINTFFTGKNAADISVNNVVVTTPDLLASGRDNIAGSNRNAQAIALAGGAASSVLDGQSLKNFYVSYVGDLASKAKAATDDADSQKTIHDTLYAQREAISGVDMNEEAINLTKYQQAFSGSARYINVINQMMQEILGLVQ